MIISDLTKLESQFRVHLTVRLPRTPPRLVNVLRIIEQLESEQRVVTQSALAQACGSNRSSVSDEIRRLDRIGYIDSKIDAADRRMSVNTVSPEGRRFLMSISADCDAAVAALLGKLTTNEKALFVALLAKVVN